MGELDEALENYNAFLKEEKLLSDLETAAVYEAPFYLRYPLSLSEPFEDCDLDQVFGDAGKTIEEAEKWLNAADGQSDTLACGFMQSIVDEDYGYAEDVSEKFRIDVANGLVKNMMYKFDDEQSGKFYMETTRPLSDEELTFMKDYYNEFHYQGLGNMSEMFNIFLGHARIIDIWNTWDDADRQTTFEFFEIPLEEYLSRTQPENAADQNFADAVTNIPMTGQSMEQ